VILIHVLNPATYDPGIYTYDDLLVILLLVINPAILDLAIDHAIDDDGRRPPLEAG
jgi:hypothetical protein